MNLQRAHDAAIKLRGNPDFEEFCEGLCLVATDLVASSLRSTADMRVDSTAFARGVMEVWVGIEAARTNQNPRQIKAPIPAQALSTGKNAS